MPSHYNGTPAEIRALNVFISLFRASDTLRIHIHRHIKEAGLTEPQFGVLETLYHLGPLEQHVLADKLLVSRGNITFIVDKLELAGLITRSIITEDRRCNRVHLTDKGRDFIARIFPDHAAFIARLIGVLDDDEQLMLAGLLKKLGINNNPKTKE